MLKARVGAALTAASLLACGSADHTSDATPTPQPSTYASKILGALDRGMIEKTRGDMRTIGIAVLAHGTETGEHPTATEFASLAAQIAPTFVHIVPPTDAWGNPYRYERLENGFRLIAPGADGLVGTGDDIHLQDGEFTKMPEGFRDL